MDIQNIESPLTKVIKDIITASLDIGITEDGLEQATISFHQYMTLCLYHPVYGYYQSGASRVGREGDFYTSAYIGEIMGEQLASELERLAGVWFGESEKIEVIDWGGGTGRLGRQMMDQWYKEVHEGEAVLSKTGRRQFSLTVVEGNGEHRRLAHEALSEYIQDGKARVLSREEGESITLSDQPVMIVANELLDAFPVYRIVRREDELWEWGVSWDEHNRCFVPSLMKPTHPRLLEWIEREQLSLLENQTIEVNLDAAEWITTIGSRLKEAIIVIIDYGDEAEELIASHRMDGTLLCYYKHRAHSDPYIVPGEQDITSHVNFSHTRQTANGAGFREIGYSSQKKFLVESGLLTKLSPHTISDPFHPIVRRNRAIRQLLLSDGMSELFKVQILLKNE